jgi:hypothetical protein
MPKTSRSLDIQTVFASYPEPSNFPSSFAVFVSFIHLFSQLETQNMKNASATSINLLEVSQRIA